MSLQGRSRATSRCPAVSCDFASVLRDAAHADHNRTLFQFRNAIAEYLNVTESQLNPLGIRDITASMGCDWLGNQSHSGDMNSTAPPVISSGDIIEDTQAGRINGLVGHWEAWVKKLPVLAAAGGLLTVAGAFVVLKTRRGASRRHLDLRNEI